MPTDGDTAREDSSKSSAQFRRFRDSTMAHPRLVAVKDRLTGAIEEAASGSLIFVGLLNTTASDITSAVVSMAMRPP